MMFKKEIIYDQEHNKRPQNLCVKADPYYADPGTIWTFMAAFPLSPDDRSDLSKDFPSLPAGADGVSHHRNIAVDPRCHRTDAICYETAFSAG